MTAEFGKGDGNNVTFQFGGICTLGLFRAQPARVWILNADAIRNDHHRPVLLVPDSKMTNSLEGSPDTVVMVPDTGLEYGVWSLADSRITIESDIPSDGHLDVVDDASWQSVSRLMEIGTIAGSRALAAPVPATATITIDHGILRAVDPGARARKMQFEFVDEHNRTVEPPRPYASQFQWLLPAKDRIKVTLESAAGRRVIEIEEGTRVMISNACFCEEQQIGQANDFLAHFAVVGSARKVRVRHVPNPALHEDPFDIRCASAVIRFD